MKNCPTGKMFFASLDQARRFMRDFPKAVRSWPWACPSCKGWHGTRKA